MKGSAGVNQPTAHSSWQCSITTPALYGGTNFPWSNDCVSMHKTHNSDNLKPLKVSFPETKSSDNLPSQATLSEEEAERGSFYLNRLPVSGEIKAEDLLDESQLSVTFTLVLAPHFCWIIGAFIHTPGVTHAVIRKNSFSWARECLEILYCHKAEAEFPQRLQVHSYYPMYTLKHNIVTFFFFWNLPTIWFFFLIYHSNTTWVDKVY